MQVAKEGGTVAHTLANDVAALVYLAGQNVVTPHVWPARADRPDRPDRLIFDFDPPGEGRFAEIRAAARELGARLRDRGLETFAMTSGSRGLHVVAPLRRTRSFQEVRAFARQEANALVLDHRATLTTAQYKSQRRGRIFVDIGRTRYAHHAVAAYAVRARPEASVATPLHWEELDDDSLGPRAFTIRDVLARLEREGGDPWVQISAAAHALPRVEAA